MALRQSIFEGYVSIRVPYFSISPRRGRSLIHVWANIGFHGGVLTRKEGGTDEASPIPRTALVMSRYGLLTGLQCGFGSGQAWYGFSWTAADCLAAFPVCLPLSSHEVQ